MNSINTKLKTLLLILSILTLSAASLYAQTVRGVVNDADSNEPLPGVNILLQGTTIGTSTNVDGEFELALPNLDGVLVVTFIGYNTTEVPINNRSYIEIKLSLSTIIADDIIVTALGLRRERRSLGYSVQEISGDQLDKARENNLVNSLTGKVAGVNITQGGTGPTASSRIVIRGENSLTGDNQPLFVVDGVPINNQSSGIDRNNRTMVADYGNTAADIDPNNIETINVLKGANATALYGSRAANGVVLITTKSGRNTQGIGISVNSTTAFEDPNRLWRMQSDYGVGSNFEFEYFDGMGGGTNDFIDESWGPRMDGRQIRQHDSSTANDFRCGDTSIPSAERGECLPSPFQPENVGLSNFYETGVSLSNNIAITGGNDDGHFRLSYTNLNSTGILPNTDLRRNNFNLNAGYKPSDKLSVDVIANYINSASDNVANSGYGTESVEYVFTWWGRNINFNNMKDYWQPGFENIEQFNYNYNWNDNPYFTLYENTNAMNRDRILGNIRLTYTFNDNLELMMRSGIDRYDDLRESRRAYSTQRFPFGMFREDRFQFNEINSDLLLTYQNNISQDISYSVSAGGNRMTQQNQRLLVSANQLSVPGVYSLNNTRVPLDFRAFQSERSINSVYGSGQIAFRNYLYLDLSARNDWSSTLPSDNNSYFYPSATISAVISDMISLPDFVSFLKLRTGYAQVGNDTDPYRLQNYYNSAGNWGSIQTAGEQNVLNNSDLKPELSKEFEIGTDIRFLNDRLGIDFTYYNIDSENQIIQVPISRASGYNSRVLNAGLVNSQGVELTLDAIPIQRMNFTWNTTINWSRDRTYVRELAEDLDVFQLPGDYISVQARVGERMGAMYGVGLLRADDGRVIHNQSGFPIRDTELRNLGNYNPDWMLGFQNNLRYKGFNLNFLFDLSYGGNIYSRSYLIRHTTGVHANTADREGTFIGDGWIRLEDGSLIENTVPLSGRDFYWSNFNRSNMAEGTFDATYLKLRELRFGYSLPSRILQNLPIQNLSLSIVGRNLWLYTPDIKDFDPDQFHITGSGRINPGIQVASPPNTRTIGFNVNFDF